MDGLHLTSAPLVPEVRLFLAEDPTILWARLESGAGRHLPAPYWASAWSGGQAIARYVLDHPEVVANCRVLDLASGSGIAAIAADLAGAASVTATDIDPYAEVAIRANAQVNAARVDTLVTDILDADPRVIDEFSVVLAGDVLYSDAMAARMLPFLATVSDRGARVLLGDPNRGWVPRDSWVTLAAYPIPAMPAGEDSNLAATHVLTPSAYHTDECATAGIAATGAGREGQADGRRGFRPQPLGSTA
jgi:predicted nicotinamide N-methyase